MNPKVYTFEAPIIVPPSPPEYAEAWLDVVEDDGRFDFHWRPHSDWPRVVEKSTGKRGRIVRTLISDIRNLPEFGRVALTFEEILVLDPPVARQWDADDWQPMD
jgi:hypothetical protein